MSTEVSSLRAELLIMPIAIVRHEHWLLVLALSETRDPVFFIQTAALVSVQCRPFFDEWLYLQMRGILILRSFLTLITGDWKQVSASLHVADLPTNMSLAVTKIVY